MPIINVQTSQTGLVGVLPSISYIYTNDSEGTILSAGYLNHEVQQGLQFSLPCIAAVTTQDTLQSPPQVGWYQVVHVAGNWSLVAIGSPGDIILPTITNHIATYTNTTGTLSDDAATAINGGNIQAGLSGTTGYLSSFPSVANKGSLRVIANNNIGDYVNILTNASSASARTWTLPDASGTIALTSGASGIVNNGLINQLAYYAANGNTISGLSTLNNGVLVTGNTGVPSLLANGPAGYVFTANSGAPPSWQSLSSDGAVLLSPSGDQTITDHNLVLANGNYSASAGLYASGVPAGGFSGKFTAYSTGASLGSLSLLCANNAGNYANIVTNSSTTAARTWTLPDATGTLALTSDITSLAVLLTPSGDQIITDHSLIIDNGSLSAVGNVESFSGNIIAGSDGNTGSLISFSPTTVSGTLSVKSADNAGDYANLLVNASTTAARTWTLPDATGTLALTSGIPSLGNFTFSSNTMSVSNSNGNINIVPNGTGIVVLGDTTPWGTTAQGRLQVTKAGSVGTIGIGGFINSASSGYLIQSKSRSSTIGSFVPVQVNDALGELIFQGDDGTQFSDSVYIEAQVGAPVSTGIVPGALVFKTTNTSGVLTSALTIGPTQIVTAPIGPIVCGTTTGGLAGKFMGYSPTSSLGTLSLVAADNAANYANLLTNASTSAARTWTLPDASGTIALAGSSAQTFNGDSGTATPSAGAITFTGSTTGLTFAGAAATMTLGGILVPANGGTGTSTPPSAGQIPIGTSGNVYTPAAINSGTGIVVANGSGSITVSATGGGVATATIAGTTQTAVVSTRYIALNAGQTTLTLPTTYAVGDVIYLVGSTANTGGWIIQANTGDTVRVNNSTTSAGGTVTSTAVAGQCIELVCDVANVSWVMTSTSSVLLTTA